MKKAGTHSGEHLERPRDLKLETWKGGVPGSGPGLFGRAMKTSLVGVPRLQHHGIMCLKSEVPINSSSSQELSSISILFEVAVLLGACFLVIIVTDTVIVVGTLFACWLKWWTVTSHGLGNRWLRPVEVRCFLLFPQLFR